MVKKFERKTESVSVVLPDRNGRLFSARLSGPENLRLVPAKQDTVGPEEVCWVPLEPQLPERGANAPLLLPSCLT
jgi:hypothetical protein